MSFYLDRAPRQCQALKWNGRPWGGQLALHIEGAWLCQRPVLEPGHGLLVAACFEVAGGVVLVEEGSVVDKLGDRDGRLLGELVVEAGRRGSQAAEEPRRPPIASRVIIYMCVDTKHLNGIALKKGNRSNCMPQSVH